MSHLKSLTTSLIIAGLAVAASLVALNSTSEPEVRTSYIVQGTSFDVVVDAVSALDAEVTHELAVISAVAANLTDDQANRLRANAGIKRLFGNASVEAAGKPDKGDKSKWQ